MKNIEVLVNSKRIITILVKYLSEIEEIEIIKISRRDKMNGISNKCIVIGTDQAKHHKIGIKENNMTAEFESILINILISCFLLM